MEQQSDKTYFPLNLNVQPAEIIQGPPEAYKNSSIPRGAVFIANWNKFDHVIDKERTGSECDVVNLKNLCKQAGYVIVKSVSDLTEPELFDNLKKFREESVHENVDSCIFVFMSHGSASYSFRTREGKVIEVENIYKEFYNEKCKALAGKPKIFIFQFCRGEEGTSSITDPDLHTDAGNFTAIQEQRGIADSIVIFSTRPRFVSYREPTKGGVFIQHFCLEFAQKAKNKEIYKLIKEVNRCLSTTMYNQKCDFQVIDGRFDFYFNPTSQEADTKSPISKGTSKKLLHTDEGAMSLDQSKDPQLPMSSDPNQSTASDTQLSSSSKASREDSAYCSSSSEDEVYGSGDDTRSTVFLVNYLEGCKEDVKRLEMTFENLEYEIHILPPAENCHSLIESIEECRVSDGGSVVVFFYGYGYRDEIFVGTSDKESVSIKKFCDLFNQKRKKGNALVVVTNICFRAKSQHTRTYSILREPLEDTFHICVRVNGTCSRGSLLTRAIIEEFKENGTSEEFYKFSRNVFRRIRDCEDEGEDLYLKDFRCYGVEKSFYFTMPQQKTASQTEGCLEKKSHSQKLQGMESQDPSSTRSKTTIRREINNMQGDVKVCDNNLSEYILLLYDLDPGSKILRNANIAVDIRQNVQGGTKLLHLLKKHRLRVKDIHIEAYPKDIECPFEFAQTINFHFRRNPIVNYFGPVFEEMELPETLQRLGLFVDDLQSFAEIFLSLIANLFNLNHIVIVVSAKTEAEDEVPSADVDHLQKERPNPKSWKSVTQMLLSSGVATAALRSFTMSAGTASVQSAGAAGAATIALVAAIAGTAAITRAAGPAAIAGLMQMSASTLFSMPAAASMAGTAAITRAAGPAAIAGPMQMSASTGFSMPAAASMAGAAPIQPTRTALLTAGVLSIGLLAYVLIEEKNKQSKLQKSLQELKEKDEAPKPEAEPEDHLLSDLYICDVSAVASVVKWVSSIKELQSRSPFFKSFNAIYMHNARLDSDTILHLLRSLRGVRMRALVLPTICQPGSDTLKTHLILTARRDNDCSLLWKEISIGQPKATFR